MFGHYSSIIEGLNRLISYVAPPITAMVRGGLFTRWATARAAAFTLIVGMCMGTTVFALDWFGLFRPDYMLTSFVSCIVCIAALYVVSRLSPEKLPATGESCLWWPSDAGAQPRRVLIPAAAVLCVYAALYAWFW